MSQGLVQYDEDDSTVTTITSNGNVNFSTGQGVTISNIPTFSGSFNGMSYPQPITYANANISTSSTTAIQTHKTNVVYVVVDKSGKCIELNEQKMMSAREIINVCKFLTTVGRAQNNNVKMNWTELIKNLGISDQFVEGKSSAAHYPSNEETLFVFLID